MTISPRLESRHGVGLWALAAIGALALMTRGVGVWGRGLWYDELISANFAAHGPLAALLSVARFDVHPPLYYLQLSLWALASRSDAWLTANSLVWSMLTPVLLAHGAGRYYGRWCGLWAGMLLAVAPAALAYSDQVRMYPMLMTLIVLVWLAQARFLDKPGFKGAALLLMAQLAVAYSQSIGLLMLSGCVVLGAAALAAGKAPRRSWLLWLGAQALTGLITLPALAVDASRNVGHINPPTGRTLLDTWTFLATGAGYGLAPDAPVIAAGLALLILLLGVAVALPRLRSQVLCLVFLPLVLGWAVSILLKPVWLDRVFLTTVPFMALTLARAAVGDAAAATALERPAYGWTALTAVVALAWLGLGLTEQAIRTKSDGYTDAARYLARTARPGDAVLLEDKVEFWVFMWRFAGSNWGDPLHSYTNSDSWARLTAKAPAFIRRRLAIERLCIPVRGVEAELLPTATPCPPTPGDVFTLGLPVEPFTLPGRKVVEQRTFAPLILRRWRAADSTS